MPKKNIIIVSHNLRIGGVERSLIGLLNSIDYSRYAVDLFLFIHDGELMPLLPEEVNLLPENKKYKAMLLGVKENLAAGNWKMLFQKQRATQRAKRFVSENKLKTDNLVYANYLQQEAVKILPAISDKEYDLAISFLTPHYIAYEKVKALKRIAWIHTDYSFFEFDKETERSMWDNYDYVASISEDCTAGFLKQFPDLKDKIRLIENILHPKFIHEQAAAFSVTEEMPKKEKEWILLSVGRFSHAKNFDNVPEITSELLKLGILVKWYLIGYGGDEAKIREKIKAYAMEEHVKILGKKDNPYPYMKACDIYVQPSRFEGKAVTVREAQILEKPVVITDYATSSSQLEAGVDGLIVPMDNLSVAKGIRDLIEDKDLQEQLKANCRTRSYGNENEIEKLYVLIP